MKPKLKVAVLIAFFAVLTISFANALPLANADWGNNNVKIVSEHLSLDGNTLIVTVSATLVDSSISNVLFILRVLYVPTTIDRSNRPILFTASKTAPVEDLRAGATFDVPFKGPGSYHTVLVARNAATGQILGLAYADPRVREGTGG